MSFACVFKKLHTPVLKMLLDYFMNILEKITSEFDTFSKSEKVLAEVILSQPAKVIHLSIAVLAKQANISEPTVNRFCRRLQTKGYPDFKLQLAQCIATGIPYVNRFVDENDTVSEYTDKIFETTKACLERSRNGLDDQLINKAVDLLTQANRISFFGLGTSSIVAHDAQNKFFRFNVPVVYFDDILMQRMSAINSKQGDVVIIISHTGRTKALVDIANLAKDNDATIIGITAQDTPLAKECHVVLSVDSAEDTDLYMPMASRIAQLTLIDVLATGFTLRRGAKFRDNLRRLKDSIKDSRFERKE